ncbi:hypothetical protein D9M68_743650 [compost metagenome]
MAAGHDLPLQAGATGDVGVVGVAQFAGESNDVIRAVGVDGDRVGVRYHGRAGGDARLELPLHDDFAPALFRGGVHRDAGRACEGGEQADDPVVDDPHDGGSCGALCPVQRYRDRAEPVPEYFSSFKSMSWANIMQMFGRFVLHL